jgi:integrase
MSQKQVIQSKKEELEPAIQKFLDSVAVMNKSTADTYRWRLNHFVNYCMDMHQKTVGELIHDIKSGKLDVYSTLGDFAAYLQKNAIANNGRGTISIKRRTNCAKLLLIFHDVDISELKFKTKVKFPKIVKRKKKAIDKEIVRKILLACEDIRLRTYIHFLAVTGMRAKEALSVRFCDIHLEYDTARVYVRGEFTKTKTERFTFLTKEFVRQFEDYKTWRQRERLIAYYDKKTRVRKEVTFKPQYRATDLIFAIPHRDESKNAKIESLYKNIMKQMNNLVDRINLGEKEEHSGFRKITRHTFRNYVKSTVADLISTDYSEWFIGHAGSTYYGKTEQEGAELFKKVEPHLTFFDISALEASHKDKTIAELSERVKRLDKIVASLATTIISKETFENTNNVLSEDEAIKRILAKNQIGQAIPEETT